MISNDVQKHLVYILLQQFFSFFFLFDLIVGFENEISVSITVFAPDFHVNFIAEVKGIAQSVCEM